MFSQQYRRYEFGGDSGGGNASAAPTSQTITNVSIPAYAQPYAERALGRAEALTDVNTHPFQPYAGQRVAAFNPLQTQAFNNIGNMQPSSQNIYGSTMAANAGNTAANMQYQPGQFNPGYDGQQFRSDQISNQNVGYGGPQFQNTQLNDQQNAQYNGGQFQNANLQNVQNAQYGSGPQFQGMGLGNERTGTDKFTDPNVAASYMNPYAKNVIDYQTAEAIRDYQKTLPQEQARAVSQGAFGGNRQALNQSEMQRNLNTQLGGIAALGMQNAYTQGAQNFQTDQGRALQSQQSNQQARLAAQGQGLQQTLAGNQQEMQNAQLGLQAQGMNQQTGLTTRGQDLSQSLAANQFGQQAAQSNLQAQLANQNAGIATQAQRLQQGLVGNQQNMQNAQFGLQANLANQQAGLTAQGQQLQQNLAGNQFNLTNAQNAAQNRLQAQQLGEQSRQYGAGLGLQGQQTALNAANQLGTLGNLDYNQQMGINNASLIAGGQQQANTQQQLANNYGDYQSSLNYPYQQLAFMQGMTQGLPMSQSSQSMYQAPPTGISSLAAAGAGLYGINGMMNRATGAAGGVVSRARGGGIGDMFAQLSRVPPDKMKDVHSVHPVLKQAVEDDWEELRRAFVPHPEDTGVASLPAGGMEFADGGIVGFAGGGSPLGRTFSKWWEEGQETVAARNRKNDADREVAQKYGLAAGPLGLFMNQSDEERQIAKNAMSAATSRAPSSAEPAPYPMPVMGHNPESPGHYSTFDSEFAQQQDSQARGLAAIAAAKAAAAAAPKASTKDLAKLIKEAPSMEPPSYTPAAHHSTKEIADAMEAAADAARAKDPMFGKLGELRKEDDRLGADREEHRRMSPYLAALAFAEKAGQLGIGNTVTALTQGAGAVGKLAAEHGKEQREMGIAALSRKQQLLATEAGLREAATKHGSEAAKMSSGERQHAGSNAAQIQAAQIAAAASREGTAAHERVGMAGIAQRANALNQYKNDDAELTKIYTSVFKRHHDLLKLPSRTDLIGKSAAEITALARKGAEDELAGDPHYRQIMARRGLAMAEARDSRVVDDTANARTR